MEAKVLKTRWGSNEIRITKTWVPNEVGELAIQFATHFGVIAAEDGGEDTGGRAKLRLQTPEEVVARSCEMAQRLYDEMRKREWVVDCPDLPENDPVPTENPQLEPDKPNPKK